MEILLPVLFVLIAIAVSVIRFMMTIRENTIRLNGLRRDDGSYADYDFPGILNGGDARDLISPDRSKPGPHEKSGGHREAMQYDLYGRPLPPDVAQKRTAEVNDEKQTVFVLMHTTGNDTPPKLLGVYGSRDSAQAAIGRYRQQEEFAPYPDGFHLDPCELDKDQRDSGS